MIGAEESLALAAAALATIVLVAMRIPGITRVFLLAQAGYWSLSYLARPAVLLWVQPRTGFGDNIADPRLADIGYDHGITMVMRPVALGLEAYAVLAVGYAIWARNRAGRDPRPRADADFLATMCVVYGLGSAGRVVAYLSGSAGSAGDIQSSNALLSFAAQLAIGGALGLIIFFRSPHRWVTMAVLGGLLVGELMWTLAVQSKTPIMGAALGVGVRFALAGWTRRRLAAIGAVSILAVGGFGWLQELKQSTGAARATAVVDAQYPPVVQPFLSVLRRFDLLEAATDAYYLGGREWLSPGEVFRYALESLVPAQVLGSEKFRSGTAWASEVRGSSVDMTQVSVSLADGNINEGFVLGGYAGVVVGVLFTFGLLLLTVRALHARHIVFVAVGLALTESPVLFERGILGSMEVVGKGLQLAGLIWIIDLTVRECRRRGAGAVGTAPAGRATGGTTDMNGGSEHAGIRVKGMQRWA